MEALKSSLCPCPPRRRLNLPNTTVRCHLTPDHPWTLSDGNADRPKPRSNRPQSPLPDIDARRITKDKAKDLRLLRRSQGSGALSPRWIRRSPEQMVQYLEDDRNGHLFGKHVVAAIKAVRSLSGRGKEEGYDMREVMASFVAKLSFREMCIVLREQKGLRQVRDFFAWMKLQLSYHPSVIAYTIVLRAYGQAGKIKLAEETFLEMLDVGCEPDDVACGTMLCAYARRGHLKAMLSFYSAVHERGVTLSLVVFNFMLSALQKKSQHQNVIEIWRDMCSKAVTPNHFTFSIVICSFVKEGILDEALRIFTQMKSFDLVPEEATYTLLICSSVKSGKQDEALALYRDMRSHGIVPSNFTCASLLALYYRNGDYSKALSLFLDMENYDIRADEVIYGLLIKIYGKLGLYDDAEKTFEETKQLGLLTDEKTYVAMAQVHLSSGDYLKALNIMEQMRSQNLGFSQFASLILLKCKVMMVGDLESARSLSTSGVPCVDMLSLYIKKGLLDKDFINRALLKRNMLVDEGLPGRRKE
ncbi:hypothetical protein Dimus_000028 [Dionaea muscipula]